MDFTRIFGCEKEVNQLTDYLFIPDENGVEQKFEILYEFERHDTGQKYILVVPADQDVDEEEQQEVFAFRYHGDQDQLTLEMIEDDKEWEIVEEMFNTWLSEEFQVMSNDPKE